MRFDQTEQLIPVLTADKDTISSQAGKLIFDVAFLTEMDPEPARLPEARAWFAELDKRHPFLPYFLSQDSEDTQIPLYASMLVPFTVEGDSLQFDRQKLEMFAVRKIQEINVFCSKYDLDPRSCIRQFCEQLHLDVIEEVVDQPSEFPFEPEKITSPFLLEFFENGYYFHTIDASDEPVLFCLIEDPMGVYYAASILDIQLFASAYYPVICIEMTIFDQPDNPLKMAFVYNVDIERHRQELYSYTEMNYITCNFLYKEKEALYYGFARAIDLPDEIRERIRRIILDASNMLRVIPKEARSFSKGVEEFFLSMTPEAKASSDDGDSLAESSSKIDKKAEAAEIGKNTAPEALASPSTAQVEDSKASDEAHGNDALEGTTPRELQEEQEAPKSEPDILEYIEMKNEENKADAVIDQRRVVKLPNEDKIPSSILPESIQRITKALSKPMRRTNKSITDELVITPAPKKVISRDEDQLERLSRRLLIMQNNLERTERENMRLSMELNAAHEEIERLRRDNLELESRWWKFWK